MGAPRWEPAELVRWRQAYRGESAAAGPDCPAAEELASLVLGERHGAERERLADHVARCARCADDYRDLRELHREAGATGRRVGRSRLGAWSAAAALAALGIGVALVWRAPAPPAGDDGAGETWRAAAALTAPAPGATLAAAPVELRWVPQAGATGYRVRLFDERGEPLWESDTGEAPWRALPPAARERLVPGGGYYWTVEVAGPVARERLGPHWFRVDAGR